MQEPHSCHHGVAYRSHIACFIIAVVGVFICKRESRRDFETVEIDPPGSCVEAGSRTRFQRFGILCDLDRVHPRGTETLVTKPAAGRNPASIFNLSSPFKENSLTIKCERPSRSERLSCFLVRCCLCNVDRSNTICPSVESPLINSSNNQKELHVSTWIFACSRPLRLFPGCRWRRREHLVLGLPEST